MATCTKQHRYSPFFASLPLDQASGTGRHKCAGCAYEAGFKAGLQRLPDININDVIRQLPVSQAGTVRHKSPFAAFSMGYNDGVAESYK